MFHEERFADHGAWRHVVQMAADFDRAGFGGDVCDGAGVEKKRILSVNSIETRYLNVSYEGRKEYLGRTYPISFLRVEDQASMLYSIPSIPCPCCSQYMYEVI